MLTIRPITITDAKATVAKWHRHNKPPVSGLFAVAAESDGKLCGVAIVGRPVARRLQDGWTCEIIRVATDGTYNACSALYGACRAAAKAMGYRRVITYTLQSEPGASLRAAGFCVDATVEARESWSCKSRPRYDSDLFGTKQRPAEAKLRWVWPQSPTGATP
jgi:hypothetical protein